MSDFSEKVLAVVRAIPRGQVMSYGEVAKQAGYPGAARAVGSLMKQNYDDSVPCHRVVRADGRAGRYNRGDANKIELLRNEGVKL
ncbi:MGMT family protein [bacterium]|nr:MGMT family protein [bacterium]